MSEVPESRCAASGPRSFRALQPVSSPSCCLPGTIQLSDKPGNYFMSSCPCHSHLRCAATLYRSTSSSSLSA